MGAVEARGAEVFVALKVVPGASRSRVVGRLGERWKVAVAAPPERGAANDEVCRVLAAVVGVPARAVRIAAGATTPTKRAAIAGASEDRVREALEAAAR